MAHRESGRYRAARVARAAQEAAAQVRRYVTDQRLARQYPGVRFTGLAVVYHGWELVHADAVGPREGSGHRPRVLQRH